MPSVHGAYRPDAPIVPELAAGAVVVGPAGPGVRVLLLHLEDEDRWCFPKGHVDPGESLAGAALREVREEAGLEHVELDREIAEVTYRFFSPKRGLNIHKTSVYFLGRTSESSVRTEPIFDRYEWAPLARARELVAYDTDRSVVDGATAALDAVRAPPKLAREK
jgi:8-oxo-dGTP pyrophosphatase MutT (NUDIX family)